MAKVTEYDLNVDRTYELYKLIEEKEYDVYCMRKKLKQKETELLHLHQQLQMSREDLPKDDVERYCRQIILPGIGSKGQRKLKESSVLIVGTGGIGCPVALYLAAAGVGRLGLVDYDTVELSNLHRQVLHSELTVGVPKVDSAAESLKRLNMSVDILRHKTLLDPSNVMEIISPYDIVVDATDNVPTRYLLNDACFLANKKPLVSGSALQMEGQLTVYGGVRGTEEGDGPRPPCYRCLFPTPPPVETISSCEDNGVLGVVPGLIGVLQALEVIKILVGRNSSDEGLDPCFSNDSSLSGKLLLLDASSCSFRSVKLRAADPKCALCGSNPSITSLEGMDYENLCGVHVHNQGSSIKLLDEGDRITAHDYAHLLEKETNHVLVDVRSYEEFNMCHLPAAMNLPMDKISKGAEVIKKAVFTSKNNDSAKLPVYVVCRRGNDSQKAVMKFREQLGEGWAIKDIIGGLHSWSEDIDPTFPHY